MVDNFLALIAEWRRRFDPYCCQAIVGGAATPAAVLAEVKRLARDDLMREMKLSRELRYDRGKVHDAWRRYEAIVRAIEAFPYEACCYVEEHLLANLIVAEPTSSQVDDPPPLTQPQGRLQWTRGDLR